MNIADSDYERLAALIHSESSPVGIDAKKTHVLILHTLERIQQRLERIEAQLRATGAPDSE